VNLHVGGRLGREPAGSWDLPDGQAPAGARGAPFGRRRTERSARNGRRDHTEDFTSGRCGPATIVATAPYAGEAMRCPSAQTITPADR